MGTRNRNKNLYNYCMENDFLFDLLIGIEGEYEQMDDTYFIVIYASILDRKDASIDNDLSDGEYLTGLLFDNTYDDKKRLGNTLEE